MKQADVDAGTRPRLTTEEREELKELRKEVKELRRPNDILQSAASYFGAELDRRHKRWSGVEPICEALRVAPSTYCGAKARPPSPRAVHDAELAPKLEALWKHNYSVYGRRKLWKAAWRAGHEMGRDQVARLMRRQGICGATRAKKRLTTRRDPKALRAPDLLGRDFTATSWGQVPLAPTMTG